MQRLHSLFRGVLLKEPNNNIQDNDGADHSALNPRLNSETDRHGQNQHLQRTNWIRFGKFSTKFQDING